MRQNNLSGSCSEIRDYGPEAFIADINRLSRMNTNYRTALWTGEHLQVTLMSIPAGRDIGLEKHDELDQLIYVESGTALVKMGTSKDSLEYRRRAGSGYAAIVPAGTWHNVINTGSIPLKLFSVYAPPQHPFGTVHRTKEDAKAAELY